MKFDKKEPNIKFRLKSTHKFLQRIKKSILPTKKKQLKIR